MRKRSQSAGPGKFDKKMGKEDSFDQVKIFNNIQLPFSKRANAFATLQLAESFCPGSESEVSETARGGGEWRG